MNTRFGFQSPHEELISGPENSDKSTERSHLITLVLQSEKALQQGQELCSVARTRSVDSAQAAVDLLAINAKVRWIVDAVSEQLKVCRGVWPHGSA